jgi:hypothetical protein
MTGLSMGATPTGAAKRRPNNVTSTGGSLGITALARHELDGIQRSPIALGAGVTGASRFRHSYGTTSSAGAGPQALNARSLPGSAAGIVSRLRRSIIFAASMMTSSVAATAVPMSQSEAVSATV